jgi:hypothetical protein
MIKFNLLVKKAIKTVLPYGVVTYVQNRNDRKLVKEVYCTSKKIFQEYYTTKFGMTSICKNKKTIKKIIYIADERSHAGGLTDRFKGMVTLYKISKKLNVDFKIHMTSPVDLTYYLMPNKYNWVIDNNEIDYNIKESAIYRYKKGKYNYSEEEMEKIIQVLFSKWNQLHITVNTSSPDEEYGELFNELFKPTDELRTNIEYHLSNIACDFISATFRFQRLLGDFIEGRYPILSHEERIILINRCVEHLMTIYKENDYKKILVTSDSITFLNKVAEYDFVYVIPGKIAHIQYELELEKEVYMKSFLDYFLLTHSKMVYQIIDGPMYKSGFPRKAALHNYISYYPYKIKKYTYFESKKNTELKILEEISFLQTIPDVPPVCNIESIESTDEGIVLQCGKTDPQIYLKLPHPLEKPAGIPLCEVTFTNSVSGTLLIFWDYGQGFNVESITSSDLDFTTETVSVLFPVVNWKDGEKLTVFRVDPPDGSRFVLKSVRILEDR